MELIVVKQNKNNSYHFTIYFDKEEKERKTQTVCKQNCEYKGKNYIPESVFLSFLDHYKLNIVIQFSSIHFMVKTTIKCYLFLNKFNVFF